MAEQKKKTEDRKPKTDKPEAKEKRVSQVRILATDIDGSKRLLTGIAEVKGVGHNLAAVVVKQLGMDPKKRLAELSEQDIDRLESGIKDPASLGIPSWMLNRRKDMDTGKDLHLNTSDLTFTVKADLDLMGEIKSYKGLRHAKGLKLRGQRTKSTGRGKSAMGVQRKKQ